MKVRPLDLFKDKAVDLEDTFDWIVAGDIVYDDDLTAAFVEFLGDVFERSGGRVEVLVSLEKRFVFTVAELDTVAPAYNCLLDCLEQLRLQLPALRIQLLETDFKQSFCYERGNDLIFIKIICKS